MKIHLNILGDGLYQQVTRELASASSAFPHVHPSGKRLQWLVHRVPEHQMADCLHSDRESVSVALIESRDAALLDKLRAIGGREFLGMSVVHKTAQRLAPVLMIFRQDLPTSVLLELPPVVADWAVNPSMHETVRRIFRALNRLYAPQPELGGGVLTLLADARKLEFCGNSVQLTPSEVAVTELFLHHFGSIVSLEDIALLFKLAGRSTEGSNIRVTMFQLRFKIEALTQCQFTLVSAYGEGYVLRHGRQRSDRKKGGSTNAGHTSAPARH